MKKYISIIHTIITTVLLIGGFALWFQKGPKKIAFVRTATIIEQYKGTQEAQALYQEKIAEWQSQVDTLQFDLKRAIDSYNQELTNLNNTQIQARQVALDHQQNQLQKYEQVVYEKASKEEEKYMQGVLNQINSFIEKYGKEKGYDLVLGTTQSGNIMYATDAIDITQEVIKGLNKEYQR